MSLQRFKKMKRKSYCLPLFYTIDIMAQVELMNKETKTGRIFVMREVP